MVVDALLHSWSDDMCKRGHAKSLLTVVARGSLTIQLMTSLGCIRRLASDARPGADSECLNV